ncbi:hypothetical protein HMPREF3033_01712 [Veillonellaceae bacterium DNF00751]|nr:hypothetical protein HMPREF3033_01712 [Veillonellaceae bacterium DNF00751]
MQTVDVSSGSVYSNKIYSTIYIQMYNSNKQNEKNYIDSETGVTYIRTAIS